MVPDDTAGYIISIHALREEGDFGGVAVGRWLENFYPRPPRGGRPAEVQGDNRPKIFLSTPSARRATQPPRRAAPADTISIHALREEGDARSVLPNSLKTISIHALREEGDNQFFAAEIKEWKFLSTPSARRATFF